MPDTPTTITVPVKSAITSKINWGAAVAVIAALFTLFGLDVPAETKVAIETFITSGLAIWTFIMRTFFTTSVISQSATPPK